jgi:archaemetzincin
LDTISKFSYLFFPGCQTEIVTPIDFDDQMRKRVNAYTEQPQYLTGHLEARLKRMKRQRHNQRELFCVGVTMADIYPGPGWNFVYGEASPEEGIGIYSFARFDPKFFDSSPEELLKPCTKEEQVVMLRRAVSTYVHEVMHLFGLEHCIYYLCLMNGTNCESEMDGQLLYLCPVCLRKMHILFDDQNYKIIDMYRGLMELSKEVGFEEEARWYENRLKAIQSD